MAKTPAKSKSDPKLKLRAARIYRKLAKTYPNARCALNFHNPFQLLTATILSAQCTDDRVNLTTPALFARYPTPDALAQSNPADVEAIVKSCGFYRAKTKSIRGAAQMLVDKHHGKVPNTMDELLELPGVARKTANVVLGNVFNINAGVVVDTHVKRLSFRMALTKHTDPVKIELDLMPLVPQKNWTMLAHLLTWHGRRICQARKPACDRCPVANDCPRIGVK